MQASTLNDLMEIYVEGPPLSSFSPDSAIKLWWNDCTTSRQVNQHQRKEYRQRTSSNQTENQTEKEPDSDKDISLLDLWDNWLGESSEPEDSA